MPLLRSIVALSLLAGPGATLAAQPTTGKGGAPKGPRIAQVQMRGIRSVDRTELQNGIVTKASSCKSIFFTPICRLSHSPAFTVTRNLDPVELRRDALRIRLFYWRHGYRDTKVATRTEPVKDGVRVVFDIDEQPPTVVQSLDVQQTDSVLPRRAIDRALQLRAGAPLNLLAADSSVALLDAALWDRGYADATVTLDTSRVSDTTNGGPVSFVLDPGALTHVSRIEVEGNSHVSDHTVRRLLDFKDGSLFRRRDVLESQRHLYLSGLFSQVDIQAPPTGDSTRVVTLHVTESNLHHLDLSGGVTTADFVQLDARFVRYNFQGSARRLTISGTLSNLLAPQLNGSGIFHDVTNGATSIDRNRFLQPTWAASVELIQPWFLSPDNHLGASIFAHRRSVPGVVIDRGEGATVAITRDFGPQTNSTLGYTYEQTTVEASNVYFCVSFGVCVAPTIRAVAGRNPLSPISLVTQIDRTDDPLAPSRGYRTRIDLEHASRVTLSDFQYNRAALSTSAYFRVSRSSVLAGRIRLGFVNAINSTNSSLNLGGVTGSEPIIHPRKRFYAGGSQSVRGFAENQMGPRVLTISPKALTDSTLAHPCTLVQLQDLSCDPNLTGTKASFYQPQPLGGTSLAEGSVEFRFPLVASLGLGGAVFVDGGILGTDSFSNLLGASGQVTPGFGIRLNTPVGPVRLDLGIRPKLVETLPVITQVTDATGQVRLVTLTRPLRYDPLDHTGNPLQQILARLVLHLAIGPAF